MKVAIFVRSSYIDQNPESQALELEKFCSSQGWEVVERIVYKESGLSREADRKGLQDALRLAESGKVEKIVLFDPSRLARDVKVFVDMLYKFNELGVSLYFTQIGMETLNPATGEENYMFKPILLTLAGFAEMRVKLDKAKQAKGIALAKKQGKYKGRKPGTVESPEKTLSKYPQVCKEITKGTSVRRTAKLCDVSINTVMKVKKAMATPA